MKPAPAPKVPGSTDAERMSNALGIVLKVSKEELDRRVEAAKVSSDRKDNPNSVGRKKSATHDSRNRL